MPLSQPPSRLATQRRLTENNFNDTCTLITVTTTYDNPWREPVTVEVESEPKSCRFIPQMSFSSRQQEYVDSEGTIQRVGAAVRLSVDEYANVTTLSMVKITKVNGETLATPMVFDVMGDPQLGVTFVHVSLQGVSR